MRDRDTDLLIEQTLSACRPRDPDGAWRFHPAWADLDSLARERLFDETARLRGLEAALDRDGLSTTAHAVLTLIRRSQGGAPAP